MLVPIALFGWLAVSLLLFATLTPRRAAITCIVAGTLFLPVADVSLPGLPDFTPQVAVAGGAMLGALLFDFARVTSLSPRWFDVPVVILALVPFATSLSNGLGAYDGVASAFGSSLRWGVPYVLGRVYFRSLDELRELAVGILIGGLLYVPLCLIEVRMSPQLHTWIYGFHQHQFAQTRRFGGFRPTVFMSHGLVVSFWMAASTLTGAWLWTSGSVRRLWGIPMGAVTGALAVTTLLCKSVGAAVLLAIGLLSLGIVRVWRQRWVLLLLLALPVTYVGVRGFELAPLRQVVEFSTSVVGETPAASLNVRLVNEEVLVQHALARKWLGWGGWNRSRPNDQPGTVTDGLWVITLSQHGIVGLIAWLGTGLVAPAVLAIRLRPEAWLHASAASGVAIAFVLTLFAIDSLLNAGVIPVYVFALGGLASVAAAIPSGTRPVAVHVVRRVPPKRDPRERCRPTDPSQQRTS